MWIGSPVGPWRWRRGTASGTVWSVRSQHLRVIVNSIMRSAYMHRPGTLVNGHAIAEQSATSKKAGTGGTCGSGPSRKASPETRGRFGECLKSGHVHLWISRLARVRVKGEAKIPVQRGQHRRILQLSDGGGEGVVPRIPPRSRQVPRGRN